MQLQEFLSYFGEPLVKALKEFDAFPGKTASFKWHEYHSMDVLLELNKVEPYSLVFHPNGNFAKTNTGGKLRCSQKDASSPYINALCFDIDTKNHHLRDKKALFDYIMDTCSVYKFQPTFIVETHGGYHIYLILKQEDRESIWNVYNNKIFDLNRYLAKILGGDDCARVSQGLDGSLRLPGSNHWKTGNPEEVKIVFENTKAIYTQEMIDCAMKYVGDGKVIDDVLEKASMKLRNAYSKVNQVPIKEVIQELGKYPRIYAGRAHVFVLKGSNVNIYYTANMETCETDGYKVNERSNYVNCLSATYHPIEERPRGGPYPFVLKYFFGDHNKTANFFKDHFGISVSDTVIIDEKEIMSLEKEDYSVVFTNKRVTIIRTVENGKGSAVTRKDIFKSPVEIVGKTMVNIGQDFGESEAPCRAYVAKFLDQVVLIHRYSNKKKFNDRHGAQTFFYGEDNDLGLFYEAIDSSDKIREIETITSNGIYGGCTVLGGKIVDGIEDGKYLCVGTKFDTITMGKPIQLKTLLDRLKGAFDERIIVPTFLQMIALAGMNLWGFTGTMPAMLLTGRTGCGKTSLVEILKHACGYKSKDRSYTISAVTKQPLSQYACDGSILFLDELTASVSKTAEELIRPIVNRDKGGRGMASGNIFYNYKAPLCVMGERTFIQESINNRFVAITMNQKFWLPNGKETMDQCRGMTCVNEIYSKYYEYAGQIEGMYRSYSENLGKHFGSSRLGDTWAFIFVINDMFKFGFSFDDLVAMADFHIGLMGFADNQKVSEDAQFELFLVRGLNNKSLILKEDDIDGSTTYRFFFSSDEYYQMYRSVLHTMIAEFNEKYEGGNIYVNSAGITLKLHKKGATKYDFFIETIMANVTSTISDSRTYAMR